MMCLGYLPPSQPVSNEPIALTPPIVASASALSIGSWPQSAK
jgi:hypothetical protein